MSVERLTVDVESLLVEGGRAVTPDLQADAIRWDLDPVPDLPVDAFLEDLFVEAVVEAGSYRALAQEAIHRLHERERRIDRQQRTIAWMREQRSRDGEAT